VVFWLVLGTVWASLGWAFYTSILLPTSAPAASAALQFTFDGRDVEILRPLFFGIILVVPVLWIVRRFTLSDLPAVQQHLTTALRALIIALFALALTRVVFTEFESHVTTVVLVDVSASMPNEALTQAQAFLEDAYQNKGEGNDLRVITFAKDPRVHEIPPGADHVPPLARPKEEDNLLGSNLQDAMRLAYGLFPQDHVKRIVIVSDGNQTEGDILGETYNARDYGIKVFTKSFDFEPRPEALVKGFDFPDEVKVGEPYTLRVEVYSTRKAKARFKLWQNEFVDGEQKVDLEPGLNIIEFRTAAYEQGTRRYKVKMTLENAGEVDTFAPNNQYTDSIAVQGKPKVLYVEGDPARGRRYLVPALTKENIDVELRPASGLPSTLGGYENFDAVIISDVPAYKVTHQKMKLLDQYARLKGGGVIMVGGENSFGPGGWYRTPVEKMLPVSFDGEKSRDTPSLALLLLIDKSGSMQGARIELAKEAAKAAVEILQRNDKIGVIAFDDGYDEIVPMQSAANRVRILGNLSRLRTSGGTNIALALQTAYLSLLQTRAAIKHIILLTDGKDGRAVSVFSDVMPEMANARITVTTVAVGRESDREFLRRVAEVGNGRFYYTADPYSIPRIFMKETSTVARSQFVEEPFHPRLVKKTQAVRGITFTEPLLGYVSTKAKPGAEVILVSEYGEPILARWRLGLGKTAVFTSDVKNRWGAQWVRWGQFPKFWAQVLRDLMRTDSQRTLPIELAIDRGRGTIVVDAVQGDGTFLNKLASNAMVKTPEGEKMMVDLQQTAPGRYQGSFGLEGYGSYVVQVTHTNEDGDRVAVSNGTLTWPYPDEYLTLAPNEKLIAKTAEIGHGEINPTIQRLYDPEGETVKHKTELWPWFLFLALALFVLDILTRRIRFYGKTSIPWEKVAGRG
jgi:Mg-chelatase subunit ChlD